MGNALIQIFHLRGKEWYIHSFFIPHNKGAFRMTQLDKALTLDEQVAMIKSYVTFRQKVKMTRLLTKEGYFRVSRYGKFLLFHANTLGSKPTQDLLFDAYHFDESLRAIFFKYTQRAEIQFKNHIANAVSLKLGDPTFYLQVANFTPSRGARQSSSTRKRNANHFDKVMKNIHASESNIRWNAHKFPEFSEYRGNGLKAKCKLPAWSAFMHFDFGSITLIYQYLNLAYRKEVIRYGFSNAKRKISKKDCERMDTWIDAIRGLRNICSHHNMLIGKTFSIVLVDDKLDLPNILVSNTDLFSRIYALKKVLHIDDAKELQRELSKFLAKTKFNWQDFDILPLDWETKLNSVNKF